MVSNGKVTVYHVSLNKTTKLEEYTRFNYDNVWFFGGKGAGINKGYENANDFDCRLPYSIKGLDFSNFAIGDVVVQDEVKLNISDSKELTDAGYTIYTITSLNNNNFGNSPHIHMGGK